MRKLERAAEDKRGDRERRFASRGDGKRDRHANENHDRRDGRRRYVSDWDRDVRGAERRNYGHVRAISRRIRRFGASCPGVAGSARSFRLRLLCDTQLGIVDRVADLKFAAQGEVGLDLIVVTPQEYRSTFAASSFGRTVLAQARRVYAA
jgi:hypothetical protein